MQLLCTNIGMQSVQEFFFLVGAFVELFTVMILGCDAQQERNWKLYNFQIQRYIGNGKIAK